jgi:hypothetical protein
MSRKSWLDDKGETTLIDGYAQQSADFIQAMADGKIDDSEVQQQEEKLVALMKKIEPNLDDQQHAELTELLCELSTFNVMQMLHVIHKSRPASTSTWVP